MWPYTKEPFVSSPFLKVCKRLKVCGNFVLIVVFSRCQQFSFFFWWVSNNSFLCVMGLDYLALSACLCLFKIKTWYSVQGKGCNSVVGIFVCLRYFRREFHKFLVLCLVVQKIVGSSIFFYFIPKAKGFVKAI